MFKKSGLGFGVGYFLERPHKMHSSSTEVTYPVSMNQFLARGKQNAEDIRREIMAEKERRKLDRAGSP